MHYGAENDSKRSRRLEIVRVSIQVGDLFSLNTGFTRHGGGDHFEDFANIFPRQLFQGRYWLCPFCVHLLWIVMDCCGLYATGHLVSG
jgi:hypothetical protein